ncbi:efflux protein RhtB [Salinisphaera sp. T5B8]|uniref:LysE family translocator n=1 Tax=Salinisphaera sp. T5B8 TaxID=1304154 RepID=UPI00333FF952
MNGLAELGSYTLALAIAAALPGPGMTALVARSIRGGTACGFSMLAGLICGDLIYLTAAVFGLAVVAKTYADVFLLIRVGAAIYLLWLAIGFWIHRPSDIDVDGGITKKTLVASWSTGLAITLGNPKTIAFYLALVPVVISLDQVTMTIWGLLLVPATVFVLLVVGSTFVVAAARAQHLLRSQTAQKAIFKTAAVIMAIAALGMLTDVF